jgi:multiple sugar transport system ATP-binding protein
MTVAQNIAYPLRVRKLDSDHISKRVHETAVLLEIEPLLARRPRELSGGERQRVALARAIVRHPRAFLMDEPLSNLDAKLRLQMRGELKRLQQTLGTTTVYVTHDQAEAMTLGHRVAVMNKGKLQQVGSPLDIYNQPANRFVAEFVGTPGMNFLAGEVDVAHQRFKTETMALALNGAQLPMFTSPDSRGVVLGIRPEDVHVSPAHRSDWHQATIYVTELMGSETFVILQSGPEKIVARAAADFRGESGSTVWIDFDMAKAHWFDTEGRRI